VSNALDPELMSAAERLTDIGCKIRNNRVYHGEAVHKGTRHPGERSSIGRPGTRSIPSSLRIQSLAPTALARRRRRCCAA
jgi:hypothetical protein